MASIPSSLRRRRGSAGRPRKLGTLLGVFTPSILTILGVILYLRTGWVVGNVGLAGAIAIVVIAHSITLALATLGYVHMPPGPTEAVIARSIVFLAVGIGHSRRGKECWTDKSAWVVAVTVGLFHGLGFAGARSEVGLPQHEIPLALLMFNVGVEIGQIAFVFAILAALAVIRFFIRAFPEIEPITKWQLVPYGIGCIAAFWTIERTMGFL